MPGFKKQIPVNLFYAVATATQRKGCHATQTLISNVTVAWEIAGMAFSMSGPNSVCSKEVWANARASSKVTPTLTPKVHGLPSASGCHPAFWATSVHLRVKLSME